MDDLAGAIGSTLEEKPFSSFKVLCRHFRIGKATCLRILHDKLGLRKFYLSWVPYIPSIDQKSKRVPYSKLRLTAIKEQKVSDLQRVVTGDESSLFVYYPRDSVWVASCDELPQRLKKKINTEKSLVSIL
jgi:hypothetical protein